MKKAVGFITLHRQIMDWEWYRHPHTAFLFIHLLLSANFVDGEYKGEVIKRGQFVRSIPQLSTDTGLSVQTVKTALAHLRLTGEITDDTSRGYRIITISKYDDYQKLTDRSTADQPRTNRQSNHELTADQPDDQHLYNNNNNSNKGTNKQRNNNIFSRPNVNDSFDLFWEAYPKKVAKQRAMAAWKKVKPDSETLNAIMEGLCRWKASYDWQKENGRYIPYPASWLNDRRWEDDIRPTAAQDQRQAPAPVKQVTAQKYEQRDYGDEDAEAWARQMELIRRMQNG